MSLKKMLLIANPVAGRGVFKRKLASVITILNKAGVAPAVLFTGKRGDATEFARNCGPEYGTVICAGGDGTLNEVICGLMENPVQHSLGYIPVGTTNDLANSLSLSKSVEQATLDILKGEARPIDIGSFNGRRFNYTASFGAFTEASYNASQEAKNLLGHSAYVLEGIMSLGNIRPYKVKISLDDEEVSGSFIFGTICNTTSLAGIIKLDKTMVQLSDGKFEVLLVREPSNILQLPTMLNEVVTQKFKSGMVSLHHSSRVTVTTDEEIVWTLDGERQEGEHISVIENLHAAVNLIVPKQDKN